MNAQLGRKKLEMLAEEAAEAKEKLSAALAKTKARISDAEGLIELGMAVQTTTSGEGMILGREGESIDRLASEWLAA